MKTKQLEYFLNKICTIFTVPINRDFKTENPATYPEPVLNYFIGKIINIDDNGVLIKQWNTKKGLRSYFFSKYIVAITEEEMLNATNPEDAKIIEEYKEIAKNDEINKKSIEEMVIPDSQEINIDLLSNISEKIKNES